MKTDVRKQSIYMDVAVIEELHSEAIRQDRSLSWIIQQAWRLALPALKQVKAPDVPR